MPTAAKPKNLAMKMAEVMAELDAPIAKKGKNTAQHYSFVNESDISAAVRPLLAERHIWLTSTIVDEKMVELFTTSSGNMMFMSKVTMQFRFIDGETGEISDTITYMGQGADTGDKALPKAISMCLKYFLLKTFMLSTGKDDAEADERVDKAAAAAGAARGARTRKSNQPQAERGGKTDATTEAQVKAVARLTGQLAYDATALLSAIKGDTGLAPAEDYEGPVRDWLYTLPGKQTADIIRSLQARVDNAGDVSGTDDGPPAEDGEQGDLAIV